MSKVESTKAQQNITNAKFELPEVLEVAGLPLTTFNAWVRRSKDPRYDIPAIPDLEGAMAHPGHRKHRQVNGLGAIFIIVAKHLVDGGATVAEALMAATRFTFVGESGRVPGGLYESEITMLVIERFADEPSKSYVGALPKHWKGSGFFPPPQWHRGYAQGRPISWLFFDVENFLPQLCRELGIEPVETARDSDDDNLEIDKR
ncbi:hypothetical protein QO034_20435 [Sedimentitalea sp. JM2-8]|uniref:Uncharacterized protein n=1 Tax=Sedimentitalea xiamensis TaxID=3050037 RepID=A0ABT7FK35_9RHOB|nr:hypothetical protein [Sedimentitalea xiamensis]MDK3075447.1 hypothetical protein [Sedimentitalea xiamensis]